MQWFHVELDAKLGTCHHSTQSFYRMLLIHTQLKLMQHTTHHHLHLMHGKVLTNTVPRPGTERYKCVRVHLLHLVRMKTLRQELLNIRAPHSRVVVHLKDGDNNVGAWQEGVIVKCQG